MKKLYFLPVAVFALAVACEKPMSEAEKNAQIEREVQQRLAAEHQAQDKERLAQQQADLKARERALAEKEAAAQNAVAATTPRATPRRNEEARSVSSSDDRAPRSYDTFYRKLEPYGSWREAGDYGYVWQPRAAQSRNWRPYTDGRWAYTEAGWTWVSSEPFGWATYHYGRWTRLRGVGWVWVPGDEWAPAWVSWRSSDSHIGWAPLPPEAHFERRTGIKRWADSYYDIGADEYVFIPNEDIGSENIERAVIPVERNITIVNETTNVTNITYVNTTIVNEGPNYEALRGRSRRPVDRLRLEREYNIDGDQTPQSSVRGNVLAIMTPAFTARAVQRPRNVGAPIPQATVERNWATGGNQPEAQRARAKMKSEATPPPDAPPKTIPKAVILPGTPAPVTEATPIPAVVATPMPVATPTAPPEATPMPAMTPRSTIAPRPSETPRPTVAPAVSVAPTPVATATRPVNTPSPLPTRMPRFTPPPRPSSTPMPAPSRGVTDPSEKFQGGTPVPQEQAPTEDGRPHPGDARAEQLRRMNEASNEKLREMRAGRGAAPALAPKTSVPQPSAEQPPEEASATPPDQNAARRGFVRPPRPLATPPPAPAAAAPGATEKRPHPAKKAAGDEDGRENPQPTPGAPNQP